MKIALQKLTISLVFFFFVLNAFSQDKTPIYFIKGFKIVDSLANKSEPKKALLKIDELNQRASAVGNTQMLVKSILYRMLFQSYLEADAFTKIINNLKKDINQSKQPERSILQSLLAESYWQYYEQNRYKFMQRTNVKAEIGNDIKTWSLAKIIDETLKNYQASIAEIEVLQRTKIDDVSELVLGDATSRYLRPTLYDLLSNRALEVFMNTQIELNNNDTAIDFNDKTWFAEYPVFLSKSIPQSDSTSFNSKALLVFQNLIKYHSEHQNLAAQADADLKRLKFIYQRSNDDNKKETFIAALKKLALFAEHTEIYADVLNEQALVNFTPDYNSENNKNTNLVEIVELTNKAIKAYPKSNGALNATNLMESIKHKTLNISIKNFNPALKPIQIYFSYKNLDTVFLKLFKVPVSLNEEIDFARRNDYEDFLASRKASKEWFVVLPKSSDYQIHTLVDKLDGLALGNYLLIAQNSKDATVKDNATSYAKFSVTNLGVADRISGNAHQYYIVNSATGEPVQGANIIENTWDYSGNKRTLKKIGSLKTDQQGLANESDFSKVSHAIIYHGTDSTSTGVNNFGYRYKPESKQLILFTDRPIYRPGQTVYYKGLFLQNVDYKNSILSGESLEIKFNDVNGQELDKKLVTTNSYGTFSGTFTIPAGKLNGRMKILSSYGHIDVQVEEYKRPAFEVVFNKPNQKYILNDSVKIQGRAVSFAGYPVSGAKVRYTVTRRIFSAMGNFYGNEVIKQIAIGKTETKAGGLFNINFLALADQGKTESYTYHVKAEITDLNGETIINSTSIIVGKKDVLLHFDLPKTMFLSARQDSIPFNVTNLNDEKIKGRVEIEWVKLKSPERITNPNPFPLKPENYTLTKDEFLKAFPYEEYNGDGDPENWPTSEIKLNQNYDAPLGRGNLVVNAKLIPAGYYKVNIKAINNSGDSVSTNQVVRIYNSEAEIIKTMSEWLVSEQTRILPQQMATFRLASAVPNTQVYYEVYYKDEVVEKKWLKISPKQTVLNIKPKANFENAFAVQFTMFQNGRVYSALKQIYIFDVDKELDVKFTSFRSKLQPGEKENWKIKISNKKGEKEMAEMLATLYDASLDELKKMNWDGVAAPYYNYSNYSWNSRANELKTGSALWFLGNYNNYYTAEEREYEKLNLFGYDYYGNYNNGYYNYLQRVKKNYKKDLTEQATKKLNALKKGSSLYGIVTDESGYGVPGVVVKSGKISVPTDISGIYSINVKAGDKLQFSFIGYKTFNTRAGSNKRLDVELKYDNNALNEIVVVGYAQQAKKEVTASAVVLREVITKPLAGKVPGLSIKLRGNSVTYDKNGAPTIDESVAVEDNKVYDFVSINTYDAKTDTYIINGKPVRGLSKVVTRTNFNETAFFYPELHTNENGEINIDFTIPQSLTRYKMMGFVQTKDARFAEISNELVTQKQLAIAANAPRFFREGDTILFTAKLNNLSGKVLKGNAALELRDALTGKLISIFDKETPAAQKFELADAGNQVLKWTLIIPSGISAISYKLLAQSDRYSDGEEAIIPVLPNSILVTESMPLNVRGGETKVFTMDKLLNSGNSKTQRNQSLTFEFTSNPVWYAVQALPYLIEYPYECAEQTFSRFYANSFATGIINSSPKIKTIFASWKETNNGEALLSNLEKNQELKSILLEETPWVRDADNETERKKRLAILFDLNNMTYELKANFEKLEKMQNANGSFPWFTGMREDRYITQHIVLGIAQLRHLKLIDEKITPGVDKMLNKAIIYLDDALVKDYDNEIKNKTTAYLPLHYLYARSYSNQKNTDVNFNKVYAYFLKRLASSWQTTDIYQQAQVALVLNRNGNKTEALKITNLLKQLAQQSDEMGMYWVSNKSGWFWYQNPIETQALLIEAFDEVASDKKSVEEMKIWLIKNKQTNDWKTTKATAAACYALLMRGSDLLNENALPEILIGKKTLKEIEANTKPEEAGTGYQKVSISGRNVKPEMATIEIKNNNATIAYGAFYWQYFEQLDKIKPAETGVKIKKQLFLQTQTAKGDVLEPLNNTNVLKPGDLLRVRIEINCDRNMEYVHLKDMRSSGFEPVNVISQYKYQDGLGYYESTKDASTNFFIDYLNKGTYVFEYSLRVTQAGNFSNGITSLQSMYAPEFTTHSEGVRVTVKP